MIDRREVLQSSNAFSPQKDKIEAPDGTKFKMHRDLIAKPDSEAKFKEASTPIDKESKRKRVHEC